MLNCQPLLIYTAELADILSGKVVCREGEDISMDPLVDENGIAEQPAAVPKKKKRAKKSENNEESIVVTAPLGASNPMPSRMAISDNIDTLELTTGNKEARKSAVSADEMNNSETLTTDGNISGDLDMSVMGTLSDGSAMQSLPSDGEILGVSSEGMSMMPC